MGERGEAGTTITKLIAAMPKVELHVHLEGCVTPEMALYFARKNRWSYPYESIEQALAAMEFSDLSSFIEVARVNNRTLRTVDDYCDVARQYLKRMHDENVVHVEVAVSPQGFMRRGLEIKPCIKALASAFREALDNFGMTGGIIAGCQRDRPPDEALEMLNELRACRDDILAVGLHGAEWQNEPRLFERHFQFARAQGWHTVAHAGEEGPADYVAQAIDILAVERIDHGVRAEEDPALLERLAADQVPLTVPALERQSRRLLTAGRTQHRATAAPWHCGVTTFRRSAVFWRLSLPLLRTDRCRARSLSRGSGRNEQECYPSRVLGPRDETKTPGGFGSRLERGGLGGV